MLAFPNGNEVDTFHLTSRYTVIQDPSTKLAYAGVIEMEWSGPYLLRPVELEEWLSKIGRMAIAPDALLKLVWDELSKLLNPDILQVTVHVEATKHGSYRLSKVASWID